MTVLIASEIVISGFRFAVVITENPLDSPAGAEERRECFGDRTLTVQIAQQNERAGGERGAGANDRREISMRIAGEQNRHDLGFRLPRARSPLSTRFLNSRRSLT